MKKIKISKKQSDEINSKWLKLNGAGYFDFKNKEILLYDGGLFAIDIEKKRVPRTKCWLSNKPTEYEINGKKQVGYEFKSTNLKGTKIRTDYKVNIWFEELTSMINYLQRMKKELNKLGYKTGYKRR